MPHKGIPKKPLPHRQLYSRISHDTVNPRTPEKKCILMKLYADPLMKLYNAEPLIKLYNEKSLMELYVYTQEPFTTTYHRTPHESIPQNTNGTVCCRTFVKLYRYIL